MKGSLPGSPGTPGVRKNLSALAAMVCTSCRWPDFTGEKHNYPSWSLVSNPLFEVLLSCRVGMRNNSGSRSKTRERERDWDWETERNRDRKESSGIVLHAQWLARVAVFAGNGHGTGGDNLGWGRRYIGWEPQFWHLHDWLPPSSFHFWWGIALIAIAYKWFLTQSVCKGNSCENLLPSEMLGQFLQHTTLHCLQTLQNIRAK